MASITLWRSRLHSSQPAGSLGGYRTLDYNSPTGRLPPPVTAGPQAE